MIADRDPLTPVAARYFAMLDADSWRVREQAITSLCEEGAGAVPTLIAGTTHRSPRVRAACVALMDHLGDERCVDSLRAALRDASALVRRHAVHAVGCQKCKTRPLGIDVVGALIERATSDSSPRVRRVAVHQLGLQRHDERAIKTLKSVIVNSRDETLVSRARHALHQQRLNTGLPDASD